MDSQAEAIAAMAEIDAWLSSMDEQPDVIYGNARAIRKLKTIAFWSGQIDKTTDSFGRAIDTYNGIQFVDLKTKAGSNTDIIPVTSNQTDLFAVRYGLDAFHAVSMSGAPLILNILPDFTSAGAVKTGEVELGPVGVVLKSTKGAAVLRDVTIA